MTYRQECGTRQGIRLHVEHGEDPCGSCLAADQARLVEVEARQSYPPPPSGPLVDLDRLIDVLAQALKDSQRRRRQRTEAA